MECPEGILWAGFRVKCHKTATHEILHTAQLEVTRDSLEDPEIRDRVEVTLYWQVTADG